MRGKRALWGVLACLLLAGCAPHADEPEGLALVRVLGVDGGGEVTLTAVCQGPGQTEPLRGSVSGDDFSSAREQLPWAGEREMALTSLSYLIINEDVDLEDVLTTILNDQELSPAALVWYTGDAAALLAGCKDPLSRLEVLVERGQRAPTAAEALAELKTFGTVDLPVLVLSGETIEVKGMIRWEGSA